MATSKYLIDIFTRHQVYLERVKAGIVGSFDPTMQRLDALLRQALMEVDAQSIGELSNLRLESLLRQIQVEEEKLLGDYARNLLVKLQDQATYDAQFAYEALDRALLNPGSLVSPAPSIIWANAITQPVQAVGQLLQPFINTWSQKNILAVEAVIRNAHAQGFTVQQTVLSIRGTKANGYRDGVLNNVQRNVDIMVRTSLQHVSNAGRQATFEANDDIVEGYRWISTLDNRTTPQCRSLDQQVFEYGKGPTPPIHLGCRSTTVPEMKETAALLGGGLKRAAKGPEGGTQVPAGQSYYQWLKNQPAAFQDEVLGPTRGKLLRNGGLSAEEFARLNLGRNFEPLTLDEMRKLAPQAFDQANL